MIYACGMRVSEIINCKLESFDKDEAFVRVLGKGDKTRLVPIGRSALDALQMYLEKEDQNWSGRERKTISS